MNKQEFSNRLAVKLDKTKKEAGLITDTFLQTLREVLVEDGKIAFTGDWSIEIIETKARKGHNPLTMEEIDIPAKRKPKFKCGKLLKDAINE